MSDTAIVLIVVLLVLVGLALTVKIVKQYEKGVLFRLGRLRGSLEPGLRIIIPLVDILHRSLCVSSPYLSSRRASSLGTT